MSESSAPALTRGIRVLQLLEDRVERSLEEIAQQTGYPKSSLTRLLETLVDLDLIARDLVSKKYVARVLLVSANAGGQLDDLLPTALKRLAEATNCTAEWYVPEDVGMMLVRRAEPSSGEVHVSAKIGFLRAWTGEFEAVNVVGSTFFRTPESLGGYEAYVSDGVIGQLRERDTRRRIEDAAARDIASDTLWNSNGVRRAATVIRRNGQPVGVLALAESMRPNSATTPEQLAEQLLDEGHKLST